MRKFFVLLSVFAPIAAHAIVATTSQTSPGLIDSAWGFVGRMSGASAVAIGSHAVLTAGHVAGGDFVLGGVTYRMSSTALAPKAGKNTTDLRIVHLVDALPGWYTLAPSVKKGAAVTMVGLGGVGVVKSDETGYRLLSGSSRHAGDNKVSSKEDTKDRGPNLRALLDGPGEAALAGGDSGGGWFSGGKLVGISSFTYTNNSKKPLYGFAKKAYFGSGAIDLTNGKLHSWILAQTALDARSFGGGFHPQAVPEPGTLLVLALGAGALARRRRR